MKLKWTAVLFAGLSALIAGASEFKQAVEIHPIAASCTDSPSSRVQLKGTTEFYIPGETLLSADDLRLGIFPNYRNEDGFRREAYRITGAVSDKKISEFISKNQNRQGALFGAFVNHELTYIAILGSEDYGFKKRPLLFTGSSMKAREAEKQLELLKRSGVELRRIQEPCNGAFTSKVAGSDTFTAEGLVAGPTLVGTQEIYFAAAGPQTKDGPWALGISLKPEGTAKLRSYMIERAAARFGVFVDGKLRRIFFLKEAPNPMVPFGIRLASGTEAAIRQELNSLYR